MGSWGTGPFDSDGALDFLAELGRSPTRSVAKCLREIADASSGQYIDVDVGSAGWAGCELVVLSFGIGETVRYDGNILDIAGKLTPKEDLRLLALKALPRFADPATSELAGLWHEGDGQAGFDASIADLRARLESAASGPRPLAKAKAGDVICFPAGPDQAELVLVQVVGSGEVAIFDGTCHDETAALEAVAGQPARRVPASANRLLRHGRLLANVPIRKELRGKKLYAFEAGAISEYSVASAAGGGVKSVSYDQARRLEEHRPHDLDAIRAVALGKRPAGRVRSPDEREADLRTRNATKWAARREATTPGPFGDAEVLERLVAWIEDYGIENAVHRFLDIACDRIGYGRPNENEERRSYAYAGLVALWNGNWPADQWPASLSGRLPSPPDGMLMSDAMAAAPVLIDRILSRDAELRLIWDDGPDDGAELRRSVDSLRRAFD